MMISGCVAALVVVEVETVVVVLTAPSHADTILLSNYLSYILLALTLYNDMYVRASKDWDLHLIIKNEFAVVAYLQLKEEALDHTVWRTWFRRVHGLVIRQTREWMNECNWISWRWPPHGRNIYPLTSLIKHNEWMCWWRLMTTL